MNNGEWSIQSSGNIYFSEGNEHKSSFLELRHGQRYEIKDGLTDNTLAMMDYAIDFDRVYQRFSTLICTNQANKITIGTSKYDADIVITSDYSGDERVVLERTGANHFIWPITAFMERKE